MQRGNNAILFTVNFYCSYKSVNYVSGIYFIYASKSIYFFAVRVFLEFDAFIYDFINMIKRRKMYAISRPLFFAFILLLFIYRFFNAISTNDIVE